MMRFAHVCECSHILLALALLALSMSASAANSADSFDRVSEAAYSQLLRDGSHAFNRKDFAEAFPLVRRAACAGDKSSQAMLGRMYILAQGVGRDDLTGYSWIKTAAEFNFTDFTSLAAKLEKGLAPEQREEAASRAETTRRKYGLKATGISCRAESRHGAYLVDTVTCSPAADGALVRLRRCDEHVGNNQ